MINVLTLAIPLVMFGQKTSKSLKKIPVKKLQQFAIQLIGIMSLVAVHISGQSATANGTTTKNQIKNQINQRQELVCLSASGNGYNWAATLTWAAEILRNAVANASPKARFNVACVSGASSGSAFVAVYGSLLQNKQLFSQVNFNPQNATPEEVLILAKSLLYMALAADYRPEVVGFYTTQDGDSQPNPSWWKSQYSLERVLLDFGTRVMLAQHLSLEEIDRIEQLNQFIRYQSLEELATAAKDKQIRQEYRRVTFEIWERSQVIIDRLYQNARYSQTARKKDRDDFRTNLNHPVRQALAKQLPEGIIAFTYAELAFTESTIAYQKMRSQAPPVNTLVPFVFTSQATAEQIIRSTFYQAQVKNQDAYAQQYVICVVPDYYTLMRNGIREPDLLPVAIHRFAPVTEGVAPKLVAGVSKFYQPLAEKKWQVIPRFKLIDSTRSWLVGDKLFNARMGIAGGWIDSYVGGQATLYLGSSYAEEHSRSHLYYSTFSREKSVSAFARNVIKKYFAPQNADTAIATLEKHRQHLPVLIERYQKYYAQQEITWQPIFVDWEVTFFPENKNLLDRIVSQIDRIISLGYNHLPVAITKQSNYLLARTMNLVRHTLNPNTLNPSKTNLYIYDRSYEEGFY
jgi:hypothetical protein